VTRLRIATFNLENLDTRPGKGPPLAARIAVLRPQLLKLDADILCLQEVNGQKSTRRGSRALAALDALVAGTPYAAFARVVSKGPGGKGPADIQNTVILSRLPVVARDQLWHDLVPPLSYRIATVDAEIETRFDRPILHAAVALPNGRRLHVLNLHLKAPLASAISGQKESAFVWKSTAAWAGGFFIAACKRAGQALEARLLVERLFDAEPDALVAVCGDFNAESRETPVRVLLAGEEDTGSRALASRVLVLLECRLPEQRRYTIRHAGRGVVFDRILASRALAAWHKHSEVHNDTLADEVFDAAPMSPNSFHAPVVAEFTLPEG